MFALFVLKAGPFFVFEHLVLPAESKGKQNTKNTKSCVKNWSNYVAQHTWTNFYITLDQFLTQHLLHFCVIAFWLKPLFL